MVLFFFQLKTCFRASSFLLFVRYNITCAQSAGGKVVLRGMYTDVHCHLLPGVDDGVESFKEAEAWLKRAREENITRVIATPHIRPDTYPNKPHELKHRFAELCERAKDSGVELQLGAEVYYRHDLAEAIAKKEILTIGFGGRYLLVELPLAILPAGTEDVFYRLRLSGVEPVLAHPERYIFSRDEPMRLAELAREGTLFQITTHSITGGFGGAVQRTAFRLLELGWVAVVASDAHRLAARPPMFREAVRVLANRYGRAAARRLAVENPRRLFNGEHIEPVACQPRRWRLGAFST